MTVTSKLPANAERNKEIEKIQEREEKAASFGGAVRGSVPKDELREIRCLLVKPMGAAAERAGPSL